MIIYFTVSPLRWLLCGTSQQRRRGRRLLPDVVPSVPAQDVTEPTESSWTPNVGRPRATGRGRSCGAARPRWMPPAPWRGVAAAGPRSEEHTSELQSRPHLVCRLLLEKKNNTFRQGYHTHKKKKNKKNMAQPGDN